MNYDRLFKDYFDNNLYRGIPVRGNGTQWMMQGNCFGDPPVDAACKGGFYCNTSTRVWQCRS